MAFATLSIDLEAKLAKFEQDLGKANRSLDSFGGKARAAFTGLGAIVAGAFSVAAVVGFSKAVVDGLDALNDLKDATGASIENLSALEDIAARTGTSMDTAGDAVLKLNRALNTASDPNSGAALSLKAIGLNVAELKRLDPVEAVQEVGKALAQFADDGDKGRIIMELFGKSAGQIAPLLKDLAEAGQLNATVTAEQAEAAETFNKHLFALQKNATDAGRAIAGPLIGAMNELVGVLRGDGPGAISQYLAVPLQAVSVLGANVAFVLKGIGNELGGIAAQAAAVARLDFKGAQNIGEMMVADAKTAREEFDKFERRLMQLGTATQASYSNEGRAYQAKQRSIGDALAAKYLPKATAAKGKTALAEFVGPEESQALKDAFKAIDAADENKLARLRDTLQELISISASGGNVPDSVFAGIAEDMAKLDPAARAAAQRTADLNALLAQTPSAQMDEVLKSIDLINEAYASGRITVEQWGEAALVATAKLKGGAEDVKDATNDVGKEMSLIFSSAAGDAITKFEDLRGVLKGVLADIAQIGMRELVTKPMSGWLSALFGGMKFASGGVFDGGLQRFASGGIVNSPTRFAFAGGMGLMGEAGPEAIMPLKRGSNGKLGVAGGGGVTVNQQISIGAGVSRNEVMAAMELTKRSTIAAIADAQRRGRAS